MHACRKACLDVRLAGRQFGAGLLLRNAARIDSHTRPRAHVHFVNPTNLNIGFSIAVLEKAQGSISGMTGLGLAAAMAGKLL